MANPTNADIMALINQNHDEMTHRMEAVEDQVRLTNGRVKDLERAEIGRKAVAEYRAVSEAKATDKKRWDTTTIILFLTMFATFIAALWWVQGLIHKG